MQLTERYVVQRGVARCLLRFMPQSTLPQRAKFILVLPPVQDIVTFENDL